MQNFLREHRLIFQGESGGKPEEPKQSPKPEIKEELKALREKTQFEEYLNMRSKVAAFPRYEKLWKEKDEKLSDEHIVMLSEIQQKASIKYALRLLGVAIPEEDFELQKQKEDGDAIIFTISTMPGYSFRTWVEPENSQRQHFALYDKNGKGHGAVIYDNRERRVEVKQ